MDSSGRWKDENSSYFCVLLKSFDEPHHHVPRADRRLSALRYELVGVPFHSDSYMDPYDTFLFTSISEGWKEDLWVTVLTAK